MPCAHLPYYSQCLLRPVTSSGILCHITEGTSVQKKQNNFPLVLFVSKTSSPLGLLDIFHCFFRNLKALLDPAAIDPQNRWVKESKLHVAFPQSLLALPEFIPFHLRGREKSGNIMMRLPSQISSDLFRAERRISSLSAECRKRTRIMRSLSFLHLHHSRDE